VTGWLVPVLSGSFWLGILAWEPVAGRLSPWALLLVGLEALTGAWFLAAGRATHDPVRAALLVEPDRLPAVRSLGGDRLAAARAPPLVTAGVMLLAFVLLGAGWAGYHQERVRSSVLSRMAPRPARMIGSLVTDVSRTPHGWAAVFGVGEVGAIHPPSPPAVGGGMDVGAPVVEPPRERVWLEAYGPPPRARRGDRLLVRGVIERPVDGEFRSFLEHQGIGVVVGADDVQWLGTSTNPLVRATQTVKSSFLAQLRRLFPAREGGLLMGLALGDTSRLDPGDEEHFRATGLGHLLAVSGENVAMVLAPILGLALLLRLSAGARFALGGGSVVFFVILTGGEPSVLRAGAMAGLTLLAALLGRPRSTPSVLGGSVLLLLLVDPNLVWSVGFQLSVAATAGMVALASPLASRMRWLPRPVAIAAATTMAAQLGVSPLLLYEFHQVPLVTVLANLLAFPAVAPALLLGLASAALALVAVTPARVLAGLSGMCIRYLEGLADRLASAPVPSVTSGGGIAQLVVGLMALGLITWWLRSGRRLPRKAVVAGALIVPLFVWSSALRAGPPGGLVVRFFDVGQGDAALVSTSGGANILVDGGPDPQLVATKLAALGVKRLDAVVATHPHLDHYVGLPTVLARVPVGLVIDSGCHPPESRSATYAAFLQAVSREGIPERHLAAGDSIVVGDLRLDVLSPDRCWNGTNSDPNNDSLVLLVTYREDTVLLANEPEADAQQVMLDAHQPLNAMVLNVPHHGADTSILPFFQAVHEQVAVVSVGPNNYGHPVPQTLDWLRSTGARVFRTDRSGDVVVRFTSPGIVVDTGRGRHLAFPTASAVGPAP
jgi:competence protein ComEC